MKNLILVSFFSLYPRLIFPTIRASSHWELFWGKFLVRTLRPKNLLEREYYNDKQKEKYKVEI